MEVENTACTRMTDVTGFGLIGHAREMALASNVALRISSKDIAILPGALECIRSGQVPGGLKSEPRIRRMRGGL